MNALSRETSPYLLQHARNPVEWYPWGAEALELAVRQDKPILLSIGYSACHWCHVMAHESFEDEATAALMNQYFINIKVDREERPDLDKIYQTAHHLLMGRGGGWPLTLFLTPSGLTPFYSGTYFPREARHGLPAFGDLLRQVAGYYARHRAEISEQNGRLLAALHDLVPAGGQAQPDAAPLDLAFQQLLQEFDERHGGFGGAPKFPQPARLEFLLRYWHASVQGGHPNAQALRMARLTLTRMAAGGLQDLLGGGFYRYAVDEAWTIPHFEKMLNDNALLLPLYAWLVAAGEADHPGGALHSTVEKIFQWITKDMQSQQGGFFAALDADSAGKEGWFYLWDREEIRAILPAGEYRLFAPAHGLDRAPNFEARWHLQRVLGDAELADRTGVAADEINQALGRARARLLEHRARRVAPARDEKILTAWNALAIRAMAIAARHLDKPEYLVPATRALDFLHQHLWQNKRLLATWKDGHGRHAACLDDHAFLLDALLEMLQVQWRDQDLAFAIDLAECILKHFHDEQEGGFFFTADDHERLLYRPKSFGDDAMPSGNGVAARALCRLGHLLGEAHYLDAAENTLRCAWPGIQQVPGAHASLLTALEEYLQPPTLIILRGEEGALEDWARRCRRPWAPRRMVFAIPSSATGLPAALSGYTCPRHGVVAYVCRETSCSEAISDLETLDRELAPSF